MLNKLFARLSLTILCFSTSIDAGEPALECRGVKANSQKIQYELIVTALNENSVVVIDTATKETCRCKFRLDNYFDQSKGMAPGYSISLAYQSCDDKCATSLKKQLKTYIDVTHRLLRKQTYSTPFVGDEMSNCDGFSIDLPALRKIAAQNIDALDLSPEAKARLKSMKGVGDGLSAP